MGNRTHQHRRKNIAQQTSSPSAPLGIKIICLLSGISVPIALIPAFKLIDLGGTIAIGGLALLILIFASLGIYVGLWRLNAWAWKAFLIFQLLGVLLQLGTGDLLGVIVGCLFFVYVGSKGYLFT